jgi:hypothetical protein
VLAGLYGFTRFSVFMSTPRNQAGTTSTAGTTTNQQGNVLGSAPATGTATVAPDASTAPAGAAAPTGKNSSNEGTVAPQASDEVAKKAAELVQTVAAAATEATSAGPTAKVKMLRNHPRVGAFADTTTDLPTELAAELVAAKYAIYVSADGKVDSPYGQPTAEQLKLAAAAFDRFRAVAMAEEEDEDLVPTENQFSDLPESLQRAFVAAIDPTYGPQA